MKVLFICHGNICRSPAGEGIFLKLLKEAGLADKVEVDSAGVIGHHAGEGADPRMQEHANRRGYHLPSLSRKVTNADLANFDYILAADRSNIAQLLLMENAKLYGSKIHLICKWCKSHSQQEVPDPYYGGASGFEEVMDILEDACREFLLEISSRT